MSGNTVLLILLAFLGTIGPGFGVHGHPANTSTHVGVEAGQQGTGLMTPLIVFIVVAFLIIFALLVRYKDRLEPGSVDVEAYRDTADSDEEAGE